MIRIAVVMEEKISASLGDHDQIRKSVIIVICPGGIDRSERKSVVHETARRDFGEGAIAIVVIKEVVIPHVYDKQINIPIVVNAVDHSRNK